MITISPVKTAYKKPEYSAGKTATAALRNNELPRFYGIYSKKGFALSLLAGVFTGFLAVAGGVLYNLKNTPCQNKEITNSLQHKLNLAENRFRAVELNMHLKILNPLLQKLKDNLDGFEKTDRKLKSGFLVCMAKLAHAGRMLEDTHITPSVIAALKESQPSPKQIRALRYYTETILKANQLAIKISLTDPLLSAKLLSDNKKENKASYTHNGNNKNDRPEQIIGQYTQACFNLKNRIKKAGGYFKTIWHIKTDYLNLYDNGGLF